MGPFRFVAASVVVEADELDRLALAVKLHLEAKIDDPLNEEGILGQGQERPGLGRRASLPEIVKPAVFYRDMADFIISGQLLH